ncbi:MAG: aconitate hydratase, partial [Lentisphaerae bacterium]|nr:aconitate hydratase [Lentisphaerota bacterium]
ANLVNFGIIPLTFRSESDYNKVTQGTRVELDDIRARLTEGREVLLKISDTGETIPLSYSFTEKQTAMLLAGGALNYMATNR